jgi:hypothetical protein
MATRARRSTSTSYTPPIEDFDASKEHFNLGVYANSGVGKTVFAASHPRSLLLAVDRGTISAARHPKSGKGKKWTIPTWEEFERAQKWVRAGGYREFEWIVLDSATMLRELCMRFTLETEHARNSVRDEFIPSQPDHQRVQNVMKRTMENFYDLPVHFLWTALPMAAESRSGEEVILPMIHGQKGDTAHYIAGLADSYGYMEVTRKLREGDDPDEPTGRKVRRIHWEEWNGYTGKDRFDCLAPYTDDATLPEIEAMIQGSGGSKTATVTRRRTTRTRRTA